jgi:hypothetical protein
MRFAPRRPRSGILATLLVAVAVLTSCGSDGPDAEWVSYSDAICAANENLRGVVLTPVFPATPGAVEAAEAASLQAYHDYVDAIRAAEPPPELTSYHQRFVDLIAMLVEAVEQEDEEARLALASSVPDDLPEELDRRFESASREAESCQRLNAARVREQE